MRGATLQDLFGKRSGRLTVVGFAGSRNGHRTWRCRCDCGNEATVETARINYGSVLSCGCLTRELNAERCRSYATHGKSNARIYRLWTGMRARCSNPRTNGYERYGGRGIRVCAEWEASFEAFYKHMGERPSPDHQIDRIDPNGNYEPGNVRWATRSEQRRNQRPRQRAIPPSVQEIESRPTSRAPNTSLTAARLKALLSYDAETGVFTRVSCPGKRSDLIGRQAGDVDRYGYIRIAVDNRRYKAHRLAWFYVTGEWPKGEIDHVNGSRSDNRFVNLRDVSRTVNAQNTTLRRARATGLPRGVKKHKWSDRYTATIGVNGKGWHLGVFDTVERAQAAYLEARQQYHPGASACR